eukprot:5780610-Amphidinium_carterae.1
MAQGPSRSRQSTFFNGALAFASSIDLVRMVATCINEITEEDDGVHAWRIVLLVGVVRVSSQAGAPDEVALFLR